MIGRSDTMLISMNIVIMAGGSGSRLWPVSRQKQPKQFLKLGGELTLLEMTYNRAAALTSQEHIFIATVEEYGEKIKALLPQVPLANIFYEPQRRDNAPAFAAVAVQLVAKGQGEEPTIFMWADHVFTEEAAYIEDVRKIPAILQKNPESIVIVGHTPTFAETGFGYIEVGDKVEGFDDVFTVKSFKEKPDAATAQKYVDSGNYFWNMGTISLAPSYLLAQLKEFEPELIGAIEKFAAALQAGDAAKAKAAYGEAKKISIDYALLERTLRIFVVTGEYGWSDVGNWSAVHDIFGMSGDHAPLGHHVHVDSQHNYIYNTTAKTVSLIGLKNTIVVVTEDAVLVTDKSKSHQVKDVVKKLEDDNKQEYL